MPRGRCAATADLEALAGHAVVMKNRAIRSEWHAPEAAAAAVCVPVSTAAIPLGTLWIFSARERDFSDEEVNLIEIVAGRLASDLEREVLVQEGLQAAALKRQMSEAERLQELQLPRAVPQSDVWDVDAWTLRGDRLGGDFYDWFPHSDDCLSLAVGSATGSGVAAAMLACLVRTSVRAHADAAREPQQLLELVNRDLWQAAAGLQSASLLYALLDGTGRIRLATGGETTALLARPAGWQLLSRCRCRWPAIRTRAIRQSCMRCGPTRRCWSWVAPGLPIACPGRSTWPRSPASQRIIPAAAPTS